MADESTSENQARAQLNSIIEMVEALRAALDARDDDAVDDATRRINEDALSVEVRSGWVSNGGKMEAEEYRILLCTGGPAVQIVGRLSEYNEPETAEIQHQDWFTPWTRLRGVTLAEESSMLTYASQFYFGE
jgi:hypothetical protein